MKLPKLKIPFLSKGGGDEEDPELSGMEELDSDAAAAAAEGGDEDAGAAGSAGGEKPSKLAFLKKLPIPSFKRGGKAGSAKPDTPPSKTRKILGMVGVGLLATLVIAGPGALVGWLIANQEHTISDRLLRQPQLTMRILAEDEEPQPNSTAEAEMEAAEEENAQAGDEGAEEEKQPGGAKDGISVAEVDPMLLEVKDEARLPVISPDGRMPWSTYARPYAINETRPRIAIVMTGLGLRAKATEAAIYTLPGTVSLSFSPYSRNLDEWLEKARKAGHEVFIDLPMEPVDYPRDDPGPFSLLTSLSTVDNLNRLEEVLGRGVGYVGVTTWMGSKFTTVEDALEPILQSLKERGLMMLDSRRSSLSIVTERASTLELPRAYNNQFLDAIPSTAGIARALSEVENTALRGNTAVAFAEPFPITFRHLLEWIPTLEAKGIVLAPATAIADRQRVR